MIRETQTTYKVAILATGDEITKGDIINSNSQEIALRLANVGMNVRMHLVAPDTIHEIEQAIQFLLKSHDALITTGGLGPTSDDLTRYALSKVVDRPLLFDNKTWENITNRLQRFGYTVPPDSNRQQALFPEGAEIIPNPNGTAAGCMVHEEQKIIFMLPGPPSECLPMVDNIVLPTLKNAGFQKEFYYHKWFLFGASEGQVAEILDSLAKPFDCITGYRLSYPYIEFKLYSQNFDDFTKLVELVHETLSPYLVGEGQQIASHLLRDKLADSDLHLAICDRATGGALQAMIETPQTRKHLFFYNDPQHFPENFLHIEIHGLKEFWLEISHATHAQLDIFFKKQGQHDKISTKIPYRGRRVVEYAVEYICFQLCNFLDINMH